MLFPEEMDSRPRLCQSRVKGLGLREALQGTLQASKAPNPYINFIITRFTKLASEPQ